MAVTTWRFGLGFEGWTFEEQLDLGVNFCTGCSALRTHVTGAMRTTLVLANLANVTIAGLHTSPLELNATIANLDTIAVDVSATSDSPAQNQIRITAQYTDETTEVFTSVGSFGAETFTLTLTQAKTLDFISVRTLRATSGTAMGSTHSRDIFEVRLTTATELTPTAGKLRTPFAFIEEEGAGAAGGAGGGASNIASISADGLNIYIASFNNLGFPTLIKILAVLSSDGSVVFNPAEGSRIGVQCGRFDADVVWIAGTFDGTNVIEKSENAGTSFAVKDDATIGTIRAFELGPLSDTTLLVMDGDNGDILETVNDGAAWTTINASVTPLVNSISRFDVNIEETAFVNQGGASNSVNYSINSGANLEDFQTGVYPNADGTKVITT